MYKNILYNACNIWIIPGKVYIYRYMYVHYIVYQIKYRYCDIWKYHIYINIIIYIMYICNIYTVYIFHNAIHYIVLIYTYIHTHHNTNLLLKRSQTQPLPLRKHNNCANRTSNCLCSFNLSSSTLADSSCGKSQVAFVV